MSLSLSCGRLVKGKKECRKITIAKMLLDASFLLS